MQYRAYEVKYEHLIMAMMIMKSNLNKDIKVNINELISYKVNLVKRFYDMGLKISLNLSPKIRRDFEVNYMDMIDTFYDFQDGLTYKIRDGRYVKTFVDKIENELLHSPVYDVIFDEELFIDAIYNNTLQKKKRNSIK